MGSCTSDKISDDPDMKMFGHCVINKKGEDVYGIVKFSPEKQGTRV